MPIEHMATRSACIHTFVYTYIQYNIYISDMSYAKCMPTEHMATRSACIHIYVYTCIHIYTIHIKVYMYLHTFALCDCGALSRLTCLVQHAYGVAKTNRMP